MAESVATHYKSSLPLPPVASNDEYVSDEDTMLTVAASGVLANDTDRNGDQLSVKLTTGPSHGTLVLNTRWQLYVPTRRELVRRRRFHVPSVGRPSVFERCHRDTDGSTGKRCPGGQ